MSNLELLKETSIQIRKEIFANEENLEEFRDFKALKAFLKRKIQEMLATRMEELLGILYRIDVDERKVKQSFKLMSEEDIAERIAELVIDRERQKVEFRRKYSGKL